MSVDQQTNDFLDSFSNSAAGLFDITVRYIKNFEQGIYGCAIAKPTKRMRNALAIEREILVVVSTFSVQQQRTIKFVLQEIHGSAGRLETTMAIVLHKDPDGNSKLRNWGRDSGISILPLFDGKIRWSNDSVERSLCMELYSHDPFDITGPVSDDANFYGRRDEAIDMARKLQKGQIRSFLGMRKVGKTSILNRVLNEIQSAHDCTCIMVDCSRDDIWNLDASSLMSSLACTAESALTNNEKYAKLSVRSEEVSIANSRLKFESVVKKIGHPLVVVFDEIDYITPGSPTNDKWRKNFNTFWRNLRAVYQEAARENHKFSVLVAGVSAHWFTVESIDGIENAALSFIPEEYLSPMPLGASTAMLRKLGKIAGLRFEDPAGELIANAAGNMPYWSRKIASYVNRNIPVSDRPCDVSRDQIEPIVSAFVREEGAAIAEVALRHLFRVYPALLDATTSCYEEHGADISERQKRVLRKYGILHDNSDSLSGSMMTSGFASIKDTPILTEVLLPSSSVGLNLSIDEWAEEIAAAGKRRNLVERKLRELALNFIRFDSMNNGKLALLQQRIITKIPSASQATLAHLNAEEAITKFNWTDLVKLIGHEWQLFEKLLGEKTLFINHCEVINVRYEAHAKPADSADFALYRRSLKYIEDKIAKVQ